MSGKGSSGRGMIVRLILSVLLVFSVLGTVVGAVGTYVLGSPSLLLSQLEKQNAAEKVHSSLQTTFETQYNTTAIPAEVYMDVITVDWLEHQMAHQVTMAYENLHSGTLYTDDSLLAVSDAVEAYFESYAEENDFEKDETYTQKLEEMRNAAESTVQNAIDVYHFGTMEKAGIFSKLSTLFQLSRSALIGCGVVSVVLGALLCWMRPRSRYWLGTSLFASGALLTTVTAAILGSSAIQRFSLKNPAVYAVFTGTMTALTQLLLAIGILLLVIGFALWGSNVFFGRSHRKNA